MTAQVLSKLRKDPRPGAQRLHKSLQARLDRDRAERLRMESLVNFERLLWKSGIRDIAGVDEVGIGPLAGPVVAAAVIFSPEVSIQGVDDSKRLDPETREKIALEIRQKAICVTTGTASVAEIDTLNIYHAALLAMRRAVEALETPPQHVLVDARTIPGITMPQSSFNKGDGLNFSIAAASIIAKTERDRMMTKLDEVYPGYGFASHKGYGTEEHRRALKLLGPSGIHRMSFPVIRELCGENATAFYEVKTQLDEARARDSLKAVEAKLDAVADALPAQEYKKLRILIARRWKVV